MTNGLPGDTEQLLPAGTKLGSTYPEGSVNVMVTVVSGAVCGPLLTTVTESGMGSGPLSNDSAKSAVGDGAVVVVGPVAGTVVAEPELRWVVPGRPEPDVPGPVKDDGPPVWAGAFAWVVVEGDVLSVAPLVGCVRTGEVDEVTAVFAAIPRFGGTVVDR